MSENVFTICLDGKDTVTVLFPITTYVRPKHFQNVTVAGIRIGKSVNTYWGVTICNPHDSSNAGRGRQVAFRKAFLQLAREKGALVNNNGLDLERAGESSIAINKKTKAAKELYDKLRLALHSAGAW